MLASKIIFNQFPSEIQSDGKNIELLLQNLKFLILIKWIHKFQFQTINSDLNCEMMYFLIEIEETK